MCECLRVLNYKLTKFKELGLDDETDSTSLSPTPSSSVGLYCLDSFDFLRESVEPRELFDLILDNDSE